MLTIVAYFLEHCVFIHVWIRLTPKGECFPEKYAKAPYVTVDVSLQVQYLQQACCDVIIVNDDHSVSILYNLLRQTVYYRHTSSDSCM